MLDGDLRFLYLAWLIGVENGTVADDAAEPLQGLAPLTPPLEALADFLCLDGDLVAAAAEAPAAHAMTVASRDEAARRIAALGEAEKDALLLRLYEGDPHLGPELRRRCRGELTLRAGAQPRRTAGELRALAARQVKKRRLAEARRKEAERIRQEREAALLLQKRLDALPKRGERAWIEIEALIVQRNASGYEKAVALLGDLGELALRNGVDDEFARRVAVLRRQHLAKRRFIERLDAVFGSPGTLV